MTKKTLGH